MIQRNRNGAFTLVEVLVVVLILGMMMALLLPAIGAVRESARRTLCLHKLRQLGTAMQSFESAHGQFPGWHHYPFAAVDVLTNKPITYSTSWFPQLLPYLGFEILFDRTKPLSWTRPFVTGVNALGGKTYSYRPPLHSISVCPSDFVKMRSKASVMSYAVNAGRKDVTPTGAMTADWRANGMFHDLWNWRVIPKNHVKTVRMDTSYIRGGDGLATTWMLSENLDATRYYHRNETANAFIFDPAKGDDFQAINGPGFDGTHPDPSMDGSYDTARPSSNHPGGVNAIFASGAGRFLHEEMDYLVYIALMTTKGSQAREPGSFTYSDAKIRNQPKLTEDKL